MELNTWLQMTATVAFAVTGVLAVSPKGIDLFGACVMGVITAVGGGTVRDLILGVPVFWAVNLDYVWFALAASVVAFFGKSLFDRRSLASLMLYLDGFGAALFAIQAANKVWDLGFALPVGPVLLGIVTAIGGGLIRDVLAGRQTLLMNRDLYAIPVLFGCSLFVLGLHVLPDQRAGLAIACIIGIFVFRAAAIRWHLTVPDWLVTTPKGE